MTASPDGASPAAENERHQLLVELRLLNGALARHNALIDVTEEEAADMPVSRLRRVVDAAQEHLTQVVEVEKWHT